MHLPKQTKFFEFSATIKETEIITKAVNEFLEQNDGNISLVKRSLYSNRVEHSAEEVFPLRISLEYWPGGDASERLILFSCSYADIEPRLIELCNSFIRQNKMITEIKYRLFIDHENDNEVGAVIAVFYCLTQEKAAS